MLQFDNNRLYYQYLSKDMSLVADESMSCLIDDTNKELNSCGKKCNESCLSDVKICIFIYELENRKSMAS